MSRFYVIFATDKPGMLAVRERVRPSHRAYLRNAAAGQSVSVRLGGPMLDARADTMNGTLLVIEAEHIDDVQRFVSDDPYMHAGIFERVEIRPWDWSLGNPERGI
ncbi:YciI family protein [Cupriavidus sp. WGlv3]|uniref:YciI family protein n=1 Tax=Cupriavidus sp. WGlv3 TaxID=2919924 RepID=UPI00209020F1|nr:YciI family protein [Cupriavidus sp. WGlv3]MCO4860753.1 YciI family protein [Cupriavidus sp. WGlv3]